MTDTPKTMASGHRLARDVPKGEIITVDALEHPSESQLWTMRAEQDRLFLS